MRKTPEFQRLNAAYRSAWRLFVVTVDQWLSQDAENAAAQEPSAAVEQAEILYRKRRDELADYILSNRSNDLSNAERPEWQVEILSSTAR